METTRHTTYTAARANFARLLDEVAESRAVVLINRRGHEDVALVAASELRSLSETAHLLRSPRNAQRLLAALHRARTRKGKSLSLDRLRRQLGVETAR